MPTLHILLIALCTARFLPLAAQSPDAVLLIAQGDSLLAQDAPGKAMERYDAAVAIAPTSDALTARARGFYAQRKYEKFLQDMNRALGQDSLHAQANLLRAHYALMAEDNPGAVRYATRVLAAPDATFQPQALVVRGEAQAALGNTGAAIADLRSGLQQSPLPDSRALKTLARLYDANDEPAASLAVLEQLCAMQPTDIGNWSNRGFELNRLERYEEALATLDTALQLDKDEPVVLSNKAHALLKLGRDAEAFSAVNRGLKSDKLNPYALCTRAQLYLRKGDRDRACNDLSLAKAMGGAPDVDALMKQYCAGMIGDR